MPAACAQIFVPTYLCGKIRQVSITFFPYITLTNAYKCLCYEGFRFSPVCKDARLTVKIHVVSGFDVGARSKVDQLEVEGSEIHQEVLVFDVPMDDSLAMAGNDGLDDLAEEVPRQLLLKHALLRDVVKEVLAGLGPLHDNDEGVMTFKAVDQLDHSRSAGDNVHQAHFQGDPLTANLQVMDTVIVIVRS